MSTTLVAQLTGKQAFAGETVSDTLTAVLRAEPQWDASPVGMRRLVRRCLEKNPKRRLRDIGDARVTIEDVLVGSAEEQPVTAAKAGRFRNAPWVLAAALLLTTLAFAWLYLPRHLWLSLLLPIFAGAQPAEFLDLAPLEGDRPSAGQPGRGTDAAVDLVSNPEF